MSTSTSRTHTATDPGGGDEAAATNAEDRTGDFAPGTPWRVRLRWELRRARPLLALEEPPVDGRRVAVDLSGALAPRRPVSLCGGRSFDAVPVFRACFLAVALHATYVDFAVYYPPTNWWYYMIYLTHWGHVLNTSYLACSLGCRLFLGGSLARWREGRLGDGNKPPFLARVTWSLYALAAPLAIAIALLYWTALVPIARGIPTNGPTLYHVHFGRFVEKYGWWGKPGEGESFVRLDNLLDVRASAYVSVMEHGVIGLLVLLDGAKVGCVPVRAKQAIVLMGLCAAYLAWSGVHCLLGIGVGDWEGPLWETDDDADDDAIYPVLNWCGGKEGIELASYVSLFAVLVLAPMSFWAVWILGLAAPRDWPAPAEGLAEINGGRDASAGVQDRRCGAHLCRCCCWKFDGSRRPAYIVAQTSEEAFAYEEHTPELEVI